MLSKHLNGQKDLNFGQNGLVTVDLGTSQSYPYCIAEQDDGKIIFIGSSAIGNLIYRFNSDGTVDDAYGVSGKATIPNIFNFGKIGGFAASSSGEIYITFADQGIFKILKFNKYGLLNFKEKLTPTRTFHRSSVRNF